MFLLRNRPNGLFCPTYKRKEWIVAFVKRRLLQGKHTRYHESPETYNLKKNEQTFNT